MKKILYTGARSGIAASTIEKLKKDYYIYVTVHNEKQLELVKEKYKFDKNIECFKLDITDKKDCEKIKKIDVDILINNAAIGIGGSIAEIDMEKVRENYEVNVFSSFIIVQMVLKRMIKKGSGKIIIMSSLAGIIPINFIGVYASTKASIIKLTETLKNELKLLKKDISICLVEPGMYHTGFNQVMLENKYSWMDKKSIFKSELDIIRKRENLLFNLLEKNNLNSITKKIVKAVNDKNPKFIYRGPFFQVMGAKIYQLFKQ